MRVSNSFKVGLMAASLIIASPSQAQEDVKVKTQKLSETVSVLYGSGGNIGVSAGEDGVYIIDDQYANMTAKIRAAIAEISDRPISYVINTHWHFDHTGGNENFAATNSAIIAHDNVRKRMVTGGFIAAADKNFPPAPKSALPIITFNDTLTLHLNGEEAKLLHVKSAHTDGDGIVWFKGSNVIHMGDTFFNQMFPFIDLDSGGSINGIIAAADMILATADENTQIIPGHGQVTDKAGLKAYKHTLISVRDAVVSMKQKDMTLEEVMAANPSADFDKTWNTWGPNWKKLFISTLYNEAK